jgi:hypothetical protein
MFQGAFSTAFYRALADALHIEVSQGCAAAEQAWSNVFALRETSARTLPVKLPVKLPIWTSC